VPGVSDSVWSAHDTTPGEVEAALRQMLKERHTENASFVPARTLNLVCIVDKAWSGEIANRLRGVGRYHASRTVVLSVDPGRDQLDVMATIASDVHPTPGAFAALRETVIVDCGERHLQAADSIVDPLVVTDLPTVVWAPHGHQEAIDALLGITQVVLVDSDDEPDDHEALRRADELSRRAYVVDLAWLRSTPWRERVAATFDPLKLRPDLRIVSAVTVRHNPESATSALLLLGWLASRLDWRVSPLVNAGDGLRGSAHARRQDVALRLEPAPDMQVRGLAGLTLETASGRHLSLDRGPGGLRAQYRNARNDEREWTILGASRGEAGILGEGIRQALLRDPTYTPALHAANGLLGVSAGAAYQGSGR
jgi:glucose-6-phosphate dehydrogenase assembly protein OpcA